jgi:hypothetical protein
LHTPWSLLPDEIKGRGKNKNNNDEDMVGTRTGLCHTGACLCIHAAYSLRQKKKKVILASKKLTAFNFDQIYLIKY